MAKLTQEEIDIILGRKPAPVKKDLTKEEIDAILGRKPTPAASAPAPVAPAPAPVAPVTATANSDKETRDALSSLNELDKAKSRYVGLRTQQLQLFGDTITGKELTPEEINKKVQEELKEYVNPRTTEFGGTSTFDLPILFPITGAGKIPSRELAPAGKPSAVDLTLGALAPQREVGAGATAARVAVEPTSVNWDEVSKQLKANSEMTDEQVKYEIIGLKAAYLDSEARDPSLNPGDRLSFVISELEKLPTALEGKGDVLRGEVKASTESAGYQAFDRQVREGSVPDLTPTQMRYMQSQLDARRADLLDSTKKDLGTKTRSEINIGTAQDPIWLPVDAPVTGEIGDRKNVALSKSRSDKSLVREVPLVQGEIDVKSQELVDRIMPELWWLDAEKKPQVLADPESFNKTNFFETVTPFGETIETPQAWALREFMAIPNAVAGIVSDLIASSAGDKFQEERSKARAADQPVYTDHPVLHNIARNKGFTGEAQESAKILEEKGIVGPNGAMLLTASGFILDLLDPTFAVIGGVVKGAKIGTKALVAGKAVTGSVRPLEAASLGLRAGAAHVLENGIPFIGSKLAGTVDPGDLRLILAADLTDSINARRVAIQLADDGKSIGEIQDALKTQFGKSSYTKYFNEIALNPEYKRYTSAELATSLRAELDGAAANSSLARMVTDVDNFTEGVRLIAAGKVAPNLVRNKELARTIGALAAVDSEVRAVIESAAAGSGTRLSDYVTALSDAGQIDKVVGQYAFARSLGEAVDLTKGEKNIENFVQVTPNTWIAKKDIQETLRFVSEKMLAGEIAKQLEDAEIRTVTSGRGIESVFVVAPGSELSGKLENLIESVRNFERIPSTDLDRMLDTLVDGTISTRDFRELMDASIDLVAEGKRVGLGSRNLARMEARRQIAMIDPIEVRSTGRQFFQDVMVKVINLAEGKEIPNITMAQRQAFASARNEMASIDIRLRRDIGRFKKDPELRAALGATGEEYTKAEIIGFLTINKAADAQATMDTLSDTLSWAANVMFTGKRSTESLLDIFTGFKFDLSGTYLSQEGKEFLDSLTNKYARAMYNEPGRYTEFLESFIGEYRKGLTSESKYFAGGYTVDDLVALGKDGRITNEVYVGAYCKSEVERIKERTLDEAFRADTSLSLSLIENNFDPRFFNRMAAGLDRLVPGIDLDKVFENLIGDRIKTVIKGNANYKTVVRNVGDYNELTTGIEGLFKAAGIPDTDISSLVKKVKTSPALKVIVSELLIKVDDVARTIIRKNGFTDNVLNIEKLLEETRATTAFDLKESLLGASASREIKKILEEGGLKKIDEWFREQALLDSTSARINIVNVSRLLQFINEMRYSMILGFRTRFHGVNTMTASLIAYSTIGASIDESLGLTKTGAKNKIAAIQSAKVLAAQSYGADSKFWNEIISKDSSGRMYTAGEVWDSVIVKGGARSASSFIISEALISDAVRMAGENINLKGKNIGDWTSGSLNRFSQQTDSFFRLNVAFKALADGRSLEEASLLAKEALFDYGRMTKPEKWLATRVFIFYTFTRQSSVNLLTNMTSAKGMQRITSLLKSKRGIDKVMAQYYGNDETSSMYLPDYVLARPVLNLKKGGKKDVISVAPSIPSNDAIVLLTSLLSGEFGNQVLGQIHPSIALPLGIETFRNNTRILSPRHVMLLDYVNAMPLMESILGGSLIAVNATPEEGAYKGFVYPLSDEQSARYDIFLRALQYVGTSTAIEDYAKTYGIFSDEGIVSATAFASGLRTDIKTERPTKQRDRLTQERIREINARIREIQESDDYKQSEK